MSESAAIHIVHPYEFDRDTTQTPGSERRAAIAPTLGIAELPIMLRPGRVTDPDGRVGGGLTHDQRQAGQLPCLTVRLGERANRSNEHGRDGDGLSFGY